MELRWSWASHKPFTEVGVFSVASSVFERLGMLALFVILTSTKQIFQPNLPRWQARKTRRDEKSTRSSKMEQKQPKNKSARPPLLKPTFSAKTPQPNLISLDVCGKRKTNFSHAAYFSSSVASTLSNSSSSSTSCRWARLKSLGSRHAHNKHDSDNTRQHP